MDLKEMAKQLPTKPGVYKMKDSLGNIIYVGKAKNLKNRVSQYFGNRKDREPKVVQMIQNIHTFDYMVTDTELDAFLEECRLIKELQPRYNRQMKNPKGYRYIKIHMNEEYPRLFIVTEKTEKGMLYFGPYTSLHRIESAVEFLKEYYRLRKCGNAALTKRAAGCLNRQLGACPGVCTGEVSPAAYKECFQRLILFLKGQDQGPIIEVMKKMEAAAEKLDFEKAAQYRDHLGGLKHIVSKQRLFQSTSAAKNILAVEFMENTAAKLFLIKGNKVRYSMLFDLREAEDSSFLETLKVQVVDSFAPGKAENKGLGQEDIDEAQIIYSYLRRNKGRILSFWIPVSRIHRKKSDLDITLSKIINKITRQDMI